jgi:Cu-Zn family superoxide dismutase
MCFVKGPAVRHSRFLPLLLPLLLLGACAGEKANVTSMGRYGGAPPSLLVATDVRTANAETLGQATLSQEPDGVWVSVAIAGLPQGDYAVHLHAVGRCEGPDFVSAGPHFNPMAKQHGSANPAGPHAGDLPNISIAANGKGRMEALLPGLQLKAGATPLIGPQGAAIVVHAGPDDYRTDPSGTSGNRIACGVISVGSAPALPAS